MTTAGLVLAAGAGTRYGGPKAVVEIDGERLVDRAVRVLTDAGCTPIFVVLGAWVGDVDRARVVVNPDWAQGMGTSLRAGLRAVREEATDAVVVTLVDLPGMTSSAVRRIAQRPEALVVATYDGAPGHPVKLGREHWDALIETLNGDAGARDYLASRSDVAHVRVDDVADGADLDTPD